MAQLITKLILRCLAFFAAWTARRAFVRGSIAARNGGAISMVAVSVRVMVLPLMDVVVMLVS